MATKRSTVEVVELPSGGGSTTLALDGDALAPEPRLADVSRVFPWPTGSGASDTLTISAPSFTGPQMVTITSTENLYPVRAASIVFSTTGADVSKRASLVVKQARASFTVNTTALQFDVNGLIGGVNTYRVGVSTDVSSPSYLSFAVSGANASAFTVAWEDATRTGLLITASKNERFSGLVANVSVRVGELSPIVISVTQVANSNVNIGPWVSQLIPADSTTLPAGGGTLGVKVMEPKRNITTATGSVIVQYVHEVFPTAVVGVQFKTNGGFTFPDVVAPAKYPQFIVGDVAWDAVGRSANVACASAGSTLGSISAELGVTLSVVAAPGWISPTMLSISRQVNALVSTDVNVTQWDVAVESDVTSSEMTPFLQPAVAVTSSITVAKTYTSGTVVTDSNPSPTTRCNLPGFLWNASSRTCRVPYNPDATTRTATFELYLEGAVRDSVSIVQAKGFINDGSTITIDPEGAVVTSEIVSSFPVSALSATCDNPHFQVFVETYRDLPYVQVSAPANTGSEPETGTITITGE